MNWQEFLPMIVVLGVAVFFVWRSSGQNKHTHGPDCGCGHDHNADAKKQNSAGAD